MADSEKGERVTEKIVRADADGNAGGIGNGFRNVGSVRAIGDEFGAVLTVHTEVQCQQSGIVVFIIFFAKHRSIILSGRGFKSVTARNRVAERNEYQRIAFCIRFFFRFFGGFRRDRFRYRFRGDFFRFSAGGKEAEENGEEREKAFFHYF